VAEEALKIPQSEATPVNEKCYPPKITAIVDQISGLNLLEVADLNELLKTRLKISDAPVIMGGTAAPAAAPAAADEEEEPEPAVAVQTSFTLKIEKYDESKKVALIKELKSQMEGMNLVQAKKFVESCPAVLKSDIAKEDAEKLKTALEGAGASCTIV
jgi:large subunit ribosomal protein L7/L12